MQSQLEWSQDELAGLQARSSEVQRDSGNTVGMIIQLKTTAAAFEDHRQEFDRQLKTTGRRLTELHDVRTQLTELQGKYLFLRGDIELAVELDDAATTTQSIEELRRLAVTCESET